MKTLSSIEAPSRKHFSLNFFQETEVRFNVTRYRQTRFHLYNLMHGIKHEYLNNIEGSKSTSVKREKHLLEMMAEYLILIQGTVSRNGFHQPASHQCHI